MADLTHEHLWRIISYSPETGELRWLVQQAHRTPIGSLCGVICTDTGYRKLTIRYKKYLGHRLAWFYMTGRWPIAQIDHINMVRHDNRWANLREASNKLNNENQRAAHANSLTGMLGVSSCATSPRYRARISTDGREIHLGVHETPEAAHRAYVEAKRKLHEGCTL